MQQMSKWFESSLGKRRSLLCAIPLLILVGFFLVDVKNALQPDHSLKVWFVDDDPQLKAYRSFQNHFGNDEVVLVNIPLTGAPFDQELSTLQSLSDSLEEVPGIWKVHSIFSLQDGYDTQDGILFDRLIPKNFNGSLKEAERYKSMLLENPNARGRLISRDERSLMFWIQMEAGDDFDLKRDRIVQDIRNTLKAELGTRDALIGGTGVIYSALNQTTQRDSLLFTVSGFGLMFLMMLFIFRSSWYVAAAVATLFSASLLTLGVYGFFGHHINMLTVILPTLVTVLGLADVVHFPPAFSWAQRQQPGARRTLIAFQAMRAIFIPCLLTSLTTIAGFLSLAIAPMAAVRELGLYAALGILIAFLVSFLYMMIAWMNLSGHAYSINHREGRFRILVYFLNQLEKWVIGKPFMVSIGCFILVVSAAFGIGQLKVDTFTIDYLPDQHPVVRDHENLEAQWGFYSPVEFLVYPLDGRSMADAELLNATEGFFKDVTQIDEISGVHGLPHIFRRLARVMGASKELNSQPFSPPLAAQLRMILDSSGFDWHQDSQQYRENFLAAATNEDFSLGRMTLTGQMVSSQKLSTLLGEVQAIANRHFAGLARVESSGYVPLYVKIVDFILRSQIESFMLAICLIFIIMLVWFRSLSLAVISLVPNLFPVAVVLGTMGFLRIHLDTATAIIAAIVVGISIDDTVHFFHYWIKGESQGLSWEKNLQQTYHHAGIPACITTLILLAGYPVLMLAETASIANFGILVTIAAAVALVSDLILLPTILRFRYRFYEKVQMPIEKVKMSPL